MIIDAVTVCIDYSDYLEQILYNRRFLKRWLIVTHKSDNKTINICKKNNLDFILSENIYKNNSPFAKNNAINEGLISLKPNNWILHLDSDILLPENFNEIINGKIITDKNTIYGINRCNINENIISTNYQIPIGFFQLWHSSKYKDYYTDNNINNAEGDIEHAKRFNKMEILNLNCIDIQQGSHKCNWRGRGAIGKTRYKLYNKH